MPRKILVSNDDGIEAEGLLALAEAVSDFGEVWVIAPDRERSGAGHSLTLHRPLRIHPKGGRSFAVDGTPTDCINLGVKEIMKDAPPDLVISGINRGPNLGDDITYSGTVSAALEGALLGIPSLAFSLVVVNGSKPNYAPATRFAKKLVGMLLGKAPPKDLILNVNVPNLPIEESGKELDVEITRCGKRHFSDAIEEKLDPRGRKYYWVGGEELGFDDIPGSDCNAIRGGKISITPIRLDQTHEKYLELMGSWKF